MKVTTLLGTVCAFALLAACGEKDVILPGERLDLRDGTSGATEQAVNEVRPISLGSAQANTDWTHRNGGPSHVAGHPALSETLALSFTANIGEGDSRRARITADPVVAGGVIFTLDARATVTATSRNGETLWQRDVTPRSDSSRSASGGGLAVSDGVVYVASGYGELTALAAETGNEIWQQDLDAPGGSAPTVSGDLVYLVVRNSRAWAIETENGRIRWTIDGTPASSAYSGGTGVALTSELAIFPFPSGEVLATFRNGGLRRWSTVVTGDRLGRAVGAVSDISADPVVVGDRVYVGNLSGRVASLSVSNGERLWTATEGASGAIWYAGGNLFFVNDLNELMRIDASNGSVVWRIALPRFEENRERRMKTLFAHYGPVIAGGRLIVASSDGMLRQFDPTSGVLIAETELPGGAASNPVVAGETLYVVNKRGQLLAFR